MLARDGRGGTALVPRLSRGLPASLEVLARAGRVDGLEGPQVAEASEMPDVMRAHTKATTMMMAERVPMASVQGRKA
jgi:choline dehydrogenase-like flavoprotein